MAAQQAQIEIQKSQANALNGQAKESEARATKYLAETKAIPVELENERIRVATNNLQPGTADDVEFERRLKVADQALKEKRLNFDIAKEAIK